MKQLALLAALFFTAAPVVAQFPFTSPDNSWITVSGKVKSATADSLTLDYAGQSLLVEMDDWDWYSEATPIAKGQEVVVTGRIDEDLFERRSIEANSVYVKNLNTYYFANSADEEDQFYPYGSAYIYDYDDFVALTGRVEKVNGRELVLDTGAKDVTVDTAGMSYNPVDAKGAQKVDRGDRVSVTGKIDDTLFDKGEVDATSIVVLRSE